MRSVEISLKEILVYILYKWIPILLCGVIIASFIGGYSFLKIPRGEALERIKEENQKIVAENEAEILATNAKIAELEQYIENIQSLSSFTNKKIAKVEADIAFDPITTDISRVRSGYTNLFRSMNLQNTLSGLIPADYSDDHLRLLIKIGIKSDAKTPNKLTITSLGGDGFDAQAVVEKVFEYFTQQHADKLNTYGEHSLTFMNFALDDAKDRQTLFDDEIKKQQNSINELKGAISYNKDIIKETRELEGTSLNSLIKPVTFGFVLGIVLGVVIMALTYVIRLVLVIPEQVQERLNIRYIGGLNYRPALTIGKLAEVAAGGFLFFKHKVEAIDYIVVNLSEMISENSTLLVTGSVPSEVLTSFSDDLVNTGKLSDSIKMIISQDITTTADGIDKLLQTDYVVLVERLGMSTLKRVKHQSDRIALSGKCLMGYVLY